MRVSTSFAGRSGEGAILSLSPNGNGATPSCYRIGTVTYRTFNDRIVPASGRHCDHNRPDRSNGPNRRQSSWPGPSHHKEGDVMPNRTLTLRRVELVTKIALNIGLAIQLLERILRGR